MWWLRNAQTANRTTLAKPEAEAVFCILGVSKFVCYQMHLRAIHLSQLRVLAP